MSLNFKSLDTMKLSRDKNSVTNAQKIEHINANVSLVPDLTHITVDCYANNFGYQSVAYIKEWFDAIHAAGKPAFFRPAWANPALSSAGIYTQIMTAASNLITCFADGDYWDVFPESNPTSGVWGSVAGWNTFVRNTSTDLRNYFASQGVSVNVDLWSVTDQNVIFNKRVEDATVLAQGNKVCIDFYPLDIGSLRVKIQNMMGQLNLMHLNYPTADIYITETGYNNLFAVTDTDQRVLIHHWLNELSNLSYVKGLNYWVGYGEAAFDRTYLFQSNSRTQPRPALYTLSEFYTKNTCNSRERII